MFSIIFSQLNKLFCIFFVVIKTKSWVFSNIKSSTCIVLLMAVQVTAKINQNRIYISLSFLKPPLKKRRGQWIDFCKRKNFVPTKSTRMCSLHFSSDAYVLSHSPEFLKSINFSGRRKLLLKADAIPTQNKPLKKKKVVQSQKEGKQVLYPEEFKGNTHYRIV